MEQILTHRNTPVTLYRRGKPTCWTPTSKEKLYCKDRETATYKPLTHIAVLDIMIDTLRDFNHHVNEIRINLGRGLKSGMVARLLVSSHNGDLKDMWTIVHGHNRRSSIKVACGFEVVACTNGCFFASEILSAMHTKNVVDTYKERLHAFVERSLESKSGNLELIGVFKNTPVTVDQCKLLVVNAALDDIVMRPLRIIKRFIGHEDQTIWGVWQAITHYDEVCSERPLDRAEDQFRLLTELARTY